MSEIEKQFFETFEIEKKPIYSGSRLYNPFIIGYEYPQITDRILLKLICIYIGYERIYMGIFEVDHFRLFILSMLIDLYKETININKKERLKHQVQELFKEDN